MKLNLKWIPLICVFIIFSWSCKQPQVEHAEKDFYSQVLDEIVTGSQIYHCGRFSEEQVKEYNDRYDKYWNGEIDSVEYFEFVTEITDAIKDTATCTFDLSSSFDVYSRVELGLSPEWINLMRADLVTENTGSFLGIPTEQIIDSITVPSKKRAADFHVDYIKLVPYERTKESFLLSMKGCGIFSFSSACFSEDNKRAVIYYEYVSDGKCGIGEIVILQRTGERWKIVKTIMRWQS